MNEETKEIWVLSGYLMPAGTSRPLIAADSERLAQAFKNNMESKGWCVEIDRISLYDEKGNEQFIKIWLDNFKDNFLKYGELK
jgi:tripartite-type tricarboxylate transporter receptor subunit TctC